MSTRLRTYDIYRDNRGTTNKGNKRRAKNFYDQLKVVKNENGIYTRIDKTDKNYVIPPYEYQYHFLNKIAMPEPIDAYNIQHTIFALYCQDKKKTELGKVIQMLNEDFIDTNTNDINDELFQDISKIFGSWEYLKDKTFSETNLSSIKNELNNNKITLSKFEQFYDKLSLFLNDLNNGISDDKLQIQSKNLLNTLDNFAKRNKKDIKNADIEDSIDIILQNKYTIDKTKHKRVSLLDSAKGHANQLKGRYFELFVLKFVKEHLGSVLPNAIVIDTAWNRDNAGKQDTADINIFENSQKIIQIGNEKLSIKEWLDRINKLNGTSEEVKIINNELNKHALRMQVKSGKYQKIFNNFSMSINDMLNDNDIKKLSVHYHTLELLKNLYQEPGADKAFKNNIRIFDNIFNYNLSHIMVEKILHGNSIFAVRNGIYFIDDIITIKRAIKAKNNSVNMHKPDAKINITQGSFE